MADGMTPVVPPRSVFEPKRCTGDFCEITSVIRLRDIIGNAEKVNDTRQVAILQKQLDNLTAPICHVAYRSIVCARLEKMASCNYFAPVWALIAEGVSELCGPTTEY